jgi:hypothetical protein
LCKSVDNLDYTNFKDAVTTMQDDEAIVRGSVYMQVWSDLREPGGPCSTGTPHAPCLSGRKEKFMNLILLIILLVLLFGGGGFYWRSRRR